MLKKPDTGGTPAKDKSIITKDIEMNCKLYAFFNSFKVFKILVLNKNIIKNIFNIDIIYTTILNNIIEKL